MPMLRGLAALLIVVALTAAPVRAQETEPSPTTYVVKSGDTLYSIARRYGVSVQMLQRLNDLSGTHIEVGQTLVVRPPEAPAPSDPSALPPTATADTIVADTAVADTAVADTAVADTAVADRAGADTAGVTDTAQRTPEARPDAAVTATPQPGPDTGPDVPSIEAFGAEVPPARTLTGTAIDRLAYGAYVIRPGDTFYSVAARFGTTGDSLFALNGQYTEPLPPGQVLRLPPRFAVPTHTVRPSDSTLYVIAAEYGVSLRALQRLNGLDTTAVAPGTALRIPGRSAPAPAPRGTLPAADARGPVAIYPTTFEGRLTASGARYDPDQLVVSHPTLPFGSVVLLTNPARQRSTFARVVDRGPVDEAVLVDVSAAVAERLGIARGSNASIDLRIVR